MGYRYETAAPDRYELLKAFSRDNRKKMTKSETILWNALRHDIQGYRFRRQHPIMDYIADFICIPQKLIIEVDGGYHDTVGQQHDDQVRADYLREKGYKILRFKNEEVNTNVGNVIRTIKEELYKQ